MEDVSAIGVDITEIDRIEAALAKFGQRFLKRVYTGWRSPPAVGA